MDKYKNGKRRYKGIWFWLFGICACALVVALIGGPSRIGIVSDADGAVTAVAAAAKLADMSQKGNRLDRDVDITTHICPNAPTQPHEPVDFMGSPVDILTMNKYEVLPEMDAIVSIDTTKGNRV